MIRKLIWQKTALVGGTLFLMALVTSGVLTVTTRTPSMDLTAGQVTLTRVAIVVGSEIIFFLFGYHILSEIYRINKKIKELEQQLEKNGEKEEGS